MSNEYDYFEFRISSGLSYLMENGHDDTTSKDHTDKVWSYCQGVRDQFGDGHFAQHQSEVNWGFCAITGGYALLDEWRYIITKPKPQGNP